MQRTRRRVFQPINLGAKYGEFTVLTRAVKAPTGPIPIAPLLQRKIVDKSARPYELRHFSRLFRRWVEPKRIGAMDKHQTDTGRATSRIRRYTSSVGSVDPFFHRVKVDCAIPARRHTSAMVNPACFAKLSTSAGDMSSDMPSLYVQFCTCVKSNLAYGQNRVGVQVCTHG